MALEPIGPSSLSSLFKPQSSGPGSLSRLFGAAEDRGSLSRLFATGDLPTSGGLKSIFSTGQPEGPSSLARGFLPLGDSSNLFDKLNQQALDTQVQLLGLISGAGAIDKGSPSAFPLPGDPSLGSEINAGTFLTALFKPQHDLIDRVIDFLG